MRGSLLLAGLTVAGTCALALFLLPATVRPGSTRR